MLPETELETIANYFNGSCTAQLQLVDNSTLFKMRGRPCVAALETKALQCPLCSFTCSVSETIFAALDRGFRRCFNRSRLTDDETKNLIWCTLPAKPADNDPLERDRWLLKLSSIQFNVNQHDWKHRESCFKNGRKRCRYNIPHLPVPETISDAIFCS